MPSYIEENGLQYTATIDSNPIKYKPILFTSYETVSKYNLHITYEDATSKTVELVQGDKNRPYRIVFKKDGKLVTATGVPKIHEVNERSNFCDFVNRTMDSNDLLFELDCSTEYECNKVRFYLKDIRDIVDIANEEVVEDSGQNYPTTTYPIYVNGFTCETKIYTRLGDNNNILLNPQITKIGDPLLKEHYDDLRVYISSPYVKTAVFTKKDTDEAFDKLAMIIDEEGFETEIKIVIGYYIKEIDHPVFDEFIIIPTKLADDANTTAEQPTLKRAVTTQDMQYLGDGLKPALGVGLTPGYKEYRNKKLYNNSVLESAT